MMHVKSPATSVTTVPLCTVQTTMAYTIIIELRPVVVSKQQAKSHQLQHHCKRYLKLMDPGRVQSENLRQP